MTIGFVGQPRTTGFIFHPLTGHYYARLDNVGDVYCYDAQSDNESKIGTATRNGKLLDLNGDFTGICLRDL